MRERFTPGPWEWWTSNSWKRLMHITPRKSFPVIEPYVASDRHPDTSVSEADMALIAAAPDLYHALEGLLNVISETRGEPAHNAVIDARKAIAKARAKS